MHFIPADDNLKTKWNDFVSANAGDGGLLQSWQWADFQKSVDRKVQRLAAINGSGELKATALSVQHDLHFEYNYLYFPRGPVGYNLEPNELDLLLEEMCRLAREEKSFMVKVDPAWGSGNENLLLKNGFRKSENEIQPKCTFIIDIQRSDDELLARMKQKTRYNINLAQKKGVAVRVSTELSDIELFWRLIRQTSDRSSFKPHTKEYYKKQFEVLLANDMAQLYLAEYDAKVIGAIIVCRFGNFSVYLHGASADTYRDVMAPYLLQWQAIVDAREAGSLYYDFGGVNASTFQNHKWNGITRFKTGFYENHQPIEYIGCFEKVINPVVYSAYKFIKQIRG